MYFDGMGMGKVNCTFCWLSKTIEERHILDTKDEKQFFAGYWVLIYKKITNVKIFLKTTLDTYNISQQYNIGCNTIKKINENQYLLKITFLFNSKGQNNLEMILFTKH